MPFLSLRGSKPKRLGIGHVPCVLFPSFLFLLRSFLLGCFSPWVGAEAPDSKQLPGSVKKISGDAQHQWGRPTRAWRRSLIATASSP